jgi:hypothetical protein
MKLTSARLPLAAISIFAVMVGGAGIAAAGPVAHPAVVEKDPVNFTPHVAPDGAITKPIAYAMDQLGDTMYVGGRFNAANNANRSVTYERHNAMAFSATTGQMSDWAPNINGDVWAVEATPGGIYLGGKFKTVNGETRPTLVKVDPVTGLRDPNFRPPFSGARVSEIQLVNGRLIVGGSFGAKLLALNPVTGKNTGYIDISVTEKIAGSNGNVDVFKFAVNPQGTRLVGIGNFVRVNGLIRTRAFMLNLDATSSSLSDWYYQPLTNRCAATTPSRIAYIKDVDFSPDGNYFAMASTGFVTYVPGGNGRDICDAVARFETNNLSPTLPTWINYTGGDTLHAVEITGAAVYVQGHSRWLDNPNGRDNAGPGAVVRPGGGSINPDTGKANDWDPKQYNAAGGYNYLATDAGLWIARDGKYFDGEYHLGIVFCPLP